MRTVIPRQKKRGPNGGVSLRCGHGKAKQKRKEKKEPMKIGKRKKSREKNLEFLAACHYVKHKMDDGRR